MDHCEMTDMGVLCDQHQQDDDCSCKNETETIKITDVFVRKNCTCPNIKILSLFLLDYSEIVNIIISSTNKTNYNSSPPLVEVNVQTEHCVFII